MKEAKLEALEGIRQVEESKHSAGNENSGALAHISAPFFLPLYKI
jgi:hypothetical protein